LSRVHHPRRPVTLQEILPSPPSIPERSTTRGGASSKPRDPRTSALLRGALPKTRGACTQGSALASRVPGGLVGRITTKTELAAPRGSTSAGQFSGAPRQAFETATRVSFAMSSWVLGEGGGGRAGTLGIPGSLFSEAGLRSIISSKVKPVRIGEKGG